MSELYALPEGWEWKKLGELCNFIRGPFGGSLKKQIFKENGNAVYEQSHAIYNQFEKIRYFIDDEKFEEMKRFELKPNSLIMSCSGTIGKVAIVPNNIKKGIINQALLMLTPSIDINNIFLKLLMESSFFQTLLSENSTGAAIANVASVKVLKEISIPLPPLQEQKRIVAKLDALFEKIDKAIALHQKNMDEADAFMGSVLNDVFGDLEEKYNLQTIESFSKVGTGSTPLKSKTQYYENGIVNWITSKATNFDFVDNAEQLVTDIAIKECKLKIYPIGTIIVALYGQGKTRGQVSELMIETATNQAVATIMVDDNQAINRYLKYFLKKSYLDLRKKASGGTQANLNLTIIKKIKLPLPPLKIQQKTVKYLDEIFLHVKRVKELQKEKMQHLKALKASILDQAFRGKLN